MGAWFNLYTFVAFLLGVFLSGWVMSLFSRGRQAVGG